MNKPKLMDQVRAVARLRHLSLRTEEAYSDWVRCFILFHRKRHPSLMRADEIRQFLSYMAVTDHVSASTQNQALCALLFLYRDVLQVELPCVEGIERAKRPTRVPVIFTRYEVERLLSQLIATYSLIASLLYGSGLRLMEALRLRVKDIDFDYQQITVRSGKGATDGEVFLVFVREVLAPTLAAGDVVIWDNLGAHRSVAVRHAVEAKGAQLVFLPPYSPDMNPIERCWSKIKTFLRAAKARTREALEAAIKQALATVTESDARAWFAHCGYALN